MSLYHLFPLFLYSALLLQLPHSILAHFHLILQSIRPEAYKAVKTLGGQVYQLNRKHMYHSEKETINFNPCQYCMEPLQERVRPALWFTSDAAHFRWDVADLTLLAVRRRERGGGGRSRLRGFEAGSPGRGVRLSHLFSRWKPTSRSVGNTLNHWRNHKHNGKEGGM